MFGRKYKEKVEIFAYKLEGCVDTWILESNGNILGVYRMNCISQDPSRDMALHSTDGNIYFFFFHMEHKDFIEQYN